LVNTFLRDVIISPSNMGEVGSEFHYFNLKESRRRRLFIIWSGNVRTCWTTITYSTLIW